MVLVPVWLPVDVTELEELIDGLIDWLWLGVADPDLDCVPVRVSVLVMDCDLVAVILPVIVTLPDCVCDDDCVCEALCVCVGV